MLAWQCAILMLNCIYSLSNCRRKPAIFSLPTDLEISDERAPVWVQLSEPPGSSPTFPRQDNAHLWSVAWRQAEFRGGRWPFAQWPSCARCRRSRTRRAHLVPCSLRTRTTCGDGPVTPLPESTKVAGCCVVTLGQNCDVLNNQCKI